MIGCYNGDLLPWERKFQTCVRKDFCNWESDQEQRTERPKCEQELRMLRKLVERKK
jgi:hypothetical protein